MIRQPIKIPFFRHSPILPPRLIQPRRKIEPAARTVLHNLLRPEEPLPIADMAEYARGLTCDEYIVEDGPRVHPGLRAVGEAAEGFADVENGEVVDSIVGRRRMVRL